MIKMNTDTKTQNCKVSANQKEKLWSSFEFANNAHYQILSLCIQLGWSTTYKKTSKEIADLRVLDSWMRSDKCPVQKPLLEMKKQEVSKIIVALENMIVKDNA